MAARSLRSRLVSGLTIGVLGVALAACGDSGDPEPTTTPTGGSTPTETETEEPEPVSFDGETITIVVPYNPGGGFDNFVRFLVPHLEEELEGANIVVKNSPGGGGLVGANEIYNSDPESLTIGLINYPGAIFAEATEAEGVTFDNTQWTLLARLGAINPLVFTNADTPYTDMEAMIAATEPIRFGIGGVGSDAYYATLIMSEVLGFPAEIIAGYPGGPEADAALLVGEVEAGVNSVDATLNRIEGSGTHMNAVISTQPYPSIPDVPPITEFGTADQQSTLTALASLYDLERILVGPPGMDEATVEALAAAIYAAASSEGYIADMKNGGLTAGALSRADIVALADEVQSQFDALAPLIRDAG